MRDNVDHEHDLDRPPPVEGAGPFSAWTGGLAGLAALAALGAWAWVVTSQEPGDIPVIAALERGPARTPPEGPDPALTPDRDITVYDAAVAQVRAEPRRTLAPPPPRPTEEDLAPREIAARVNAAAAPAPAGANGPQVTGPVPPSGTGSEAAPASVPVVAARPMHLARRMRAASKEVIAETRALAERAASAPWQIQLGAFREPRVTREQWQLISGTHTDLLQGRALAVQETVSGGETFYRLRVGPFEAEREAANLCAALRARGQQCITAENR